MTGSSLRDGTPTGDTTFRPHRILTCGALHRVREGPGGQDNIGGVRDTIPEGPLVA
jgi:hypothetical protein